MAFPLQLATLPFTLAICRLDPTSPFPAWSVPSRFLAIVRTDEELSLVCEQTLAPPDVVCERDWRALKVAGPLDFALTGILARLAGPLADAGIPIFVISTYDTDYLLVKGEQLPAASAALCAAGCTVR